MPQTSVTACPCCGCDGMVPAVKQFAEYLVGRGFQINSGFRCTSHNQDVGGVPNSRHLVGDALDLKRPIHDKNINEWLTAIMNREPTFVKIYNWGVHVDWRPES